MFIAFRLMLRETETRIIAVAALLTIAIGSLVYMEIEGWSPLDAVYFCVVTLATVGYGDLHPTTPLGRAFTILYILVGVGILAAFITGLAKSTDGPGRSDRRAPRARVRPSGRDRDWRGSVAEGGPRGSAGGLDQLDENPVARARVEERDRTLGALAGCGVDQLDPVDGQPGERLGQVRDLEADVVEALPLGLEEARDTRGIVSRADQFDLGFAHRQERDPDAVGRDGQDRLELQPQDSR